jgi:hypothetical protein
MNFRAHHEDIFQSLLLVLKNETSPFNESLLSEIADHFFIVIKIFLDMLVSFSQNTTHTSY